MEMLAEDVNRQFIEEGSKRPANTQRDPQSHC